MFRDAVILWSVFEHARSLGSGTCILITADGALRKPEIADIANVRVYSVSPLETINELIDELVKSLAEAEQQSLEADEVRARAALEADRDKIQASSALGLKSRTRPTNALRYSGLYYSPRLGRFHERAYPIPIA